MEREERNSWIQKFEKLPTGNVCDAMDQLNLPRAAIQGLSCVHAFQSSVAGFAFTIQQTKRIEPWDGHNLAVHGNIMDAQIQPGDIVVIATNRYMKCSTGGGILALRAKIRGAKGEITDGCLRDVSELQRMDFPVFLGGTNPLKSSHDLETTAQNVPVVIENVKICPEDLLLMDATGIVCVPNKKLQEVYDFACKVHDKEEKMVEAIKQGKSLMEARKISIL